MIEKVARRVPENGICKLCSRLPTIISKLAHKPPATAAFIHIEFKAFSILLCSETGWYAFEILFAIDIQEEVRMPAFHLF